MKNCTDLGGFHPPWSTLLDSSLIIYIMLNTPRNRYCYYICCGSILSFVQSLFPFVWGQGKIVIMNLKQREIKFKPRIKLNRDMYKTVKESEF